MPILCPVQVMITLWHETRHLASLGPKLSVCTAPWVSTRFPPQAPYQFVKCLVLLRGKVIQVVQSTLFFVLEKPASFRVSLIKTAAVVIQAPLMERVSGEIAKGRISWWMSWAAGVSHMDLCRIFTSAVLAGTPVLLYQDTLLAGPALPLAAARPWLRAGC